MTALVIAYSNRDSLLLKVTRELNKNINGTVTVGKIDFTFLHNFPSFSVTLHDVTIRHGQYEKYPVDVMRAATVFADLQLLPLIRKEIIIDALAINKGNIFIFKALNGDTNTDILRRDSTTQVSDTTSGPTINLSHIALRNVLMRYADSTKHKFLQFQFINTSQAIERLDSGFKMGIKGDVHFDSLYFNPKGGSFLKNKDVQVDLAMKINRIGGKINILPSLVEYDKHTLAISGKLDVRPEGHYTLIFEGKDLKPQNVTELLNVKLKQTLAKFEIKGDVAVTVRLQGRSIPGLVPKVDVDFATDKADVKYGGLVFSAVTLKGDFTNSLDSTQAKDNANSRVRITAFKGQMENLPLTGKVTFYNLGDPIMDLAFTANPSYRQLNDLLDNSRFVLDKGNFQSTVNYHGKVSEYLDPTRTSYTGKLSGSIKAKDISFHYNPKKIHFDNMRLAASFDEKTFRIEKLESLVNGSLVNIEGEMRNFIPFFITPQNRGYVSLKVSSPEFDLTSLAAKRRTHEKRSESVKKQQGKKMSDLLDMIYDRLHFEIDVRADKIQFRKFTSTDFQGRLTLDNQELRANPVSMTIAEGRMNLDLSLSEIFQPASTMAITAVLEKADIKNVFLNFNNFNQSTIRADNLDGNISANVVFNAQLDEAFTVIPNSMEGRLTCMITDGSLKDFEPMENMSNFLFKKRDFSDVQFAALNSSFDIKGTNLDIDRMEIQSSVFSLFLEGRYSFTDSTSLSVQLPLSNLKKRHKDFKPKNIGVDAKIGPSIFLHVYRNKDINSKIQIDYDPFKKWAKK
jgi:hypothetical protein